MLQNNLQYGIGSYILMGEFFNDFTEILGIAYSLPNENSRIERILTDGKIVIYNILDVVYVVFTPTKETSRNENEEI